MFAATLFELGIECDIKYGKEITISDRNHLRYVLENNGLHCWLEFNNYIIDFKLCKVMEYYICARINRKCESKFFNLYKHTNMIGIDFEHIFYQGIRVKDAKIIMRNAYIRNNMTLYKDDRSHDQYINLAKYIADRYREEVNSK